MPSTVQSCPLFTYTASTAVPGSLAGARMTTASCPVIWFFTTSCPYPPCSSHTICVPVVKLRTGGIVGGAVVVEGPGVTVTVGATVGEAPNGAGQTHPDSTTFINI